MGFQAESCLSARCRMDAGLKGSCLEGSGTSCNPTLAGSTTLPSLQRDQKPRIDVVEMPKKKLQCLWGFCVPRAQAGLGRAVPDTQGGRHQGILPQHPWGCSRLTENLRLALGGGS